MALFGEGDIYIGRSLKIFADRVVKACLNMGAKRISSFHMPSCNVNVHVFLLSYDPALESSQSSACE
jgi:hypothetical protein